MLISSRFKLLAAPPPVTAHIAVLAGLALLALLTVYRSFGEFGFYYDDWRFLQELVQDGSIETVFWGRPIHQPLTELVFGFVGLSPLVGYALLTVLLIASALAMYWMMLLLFPRRRALAVLAAVFYLLYPGDLSRTWITAGLTANRPAILLALISLCLLFAGIRLSRRHHLASQGLIAASVGIYLLSLFLYETQALLVPAMAFAGTAWIRTSGKGLVHRSAARNIAKGAARTTAPYAFVLVLVGIARIVLTEVGAEDRFAATANYSPLYLARQLIGVYYFNFLEQPVEVIVNAVPFLGQLSILSIVGAMAAVAMVVGPVVYFARRINTVERSTSPLDRPATPVETMFYRNLLLVSLVLTGIVYLVLLPHDHIISASGLRGPFVSRLNSAGAVVVAMSAAAGFMLAWTWSLARWREHRTGLNVMAAGTLAVVLLLLVSFHGIVQDDYADAWALQQRYAGQVMAAMPEARSGSHIHVIGVPSTYGSSYVFMYSLEHMLRLAYDEPGLTATAAPDFDGRYRITSSGLFLDDELISAAGNTWYFTLVPGDCEGEPRPACAKLVMSAPTRNIRSGPGEPLSEMRRETLALLGIEPEHDAAEQPTTKFAAPAEPSR